jgi:hypothetical protein
MPGSPKLTVGRKLVDRAQKARGRTPLKFEFEVIPFFAGKRCCGWLAKYCGIMTCPAHGLNA